MKTIIMVVILLTIMPLVLAATDTQEVDDVFRINVFTIYKKPCFNNGSYCSSSAVCNYTIFNPDNTLVLDNQIATNKVTNHEVNFTPHNIGVYKVDMICVDGGRNGAETLYFEVTGDGFNNTIWFYILILALSAGIMIAGFKLTDPTITMFGTFGLYFLAIYILRFGIVGMKDVTTTWAIGLITLGVAMYVSARIGLEIINS